MKYTLAKNIILISILFFNFGCGSFNKLDLSNSFWGTVESEVSYIYTSNNLSSKLFKEIKKGTIIYFYKEIGEYYIVYTQNPNKFKTKKLREKNQYYLYKPKYKKLNYSYKKGYATIYELPYDPNREYISGERGGCFYINKHGNKTYVSRNYCDAATARSNTYKYKTNKSTRSNSSVQCSGKTKKGIRCKNRTTNRSGRCHLH